MLFEKSMAFKNAFWQDYWLNYNTSLYKNNGRMIKMPAEVYSCVFFFTFIFYSWFLKNFFESYIYLAGIFRTSSLRRQCVK